MINRKLYNKIMSDISSIIKNKLNENVFTDGRYDRWKTSTPYDDEIDDELPVIELDIIDILNSTVIDDDKCEELINICKKSGIMEDTTVEVVIDDYTYEIIEDNQLTAALNQIKSKKYHDIIEKYVLDELNRQIEIKRTMGFDETDYKEAYKKQQEHDYNIGRREMRYEF